MVGLITRSNKEKASFYIFESDRILDSGKYKASVPRLKKLERSFSDLKQLFVYRTYIQEAGNDSTIFTLLDEWNAYSSEGLLAIKLNKRLPCQLGSSSTTLDSSREMRILVARALELLHRHRPNVYRKLRGDASVRELIELLEKRTGEIIAATPANACLAGDLTSQREFLRLEDTSAVILKGFLKRSEN